MISFFLPFCKKKIAPSGTMTHKKEITLDDFEHSLLIVKGYSSEFLGSIIG